MQCTAHNDAVRMPNLSQHTRLLRNKSTMSAIAAIIAAPVTFASAICRDQP